MFGKRLSRRSFAAAAAGTVLATPTFRNRDVSSQTRMPEPIELGQGLLLVDYRIYPTSNARPAMLGEIKSTLDHRVDAVSISMIDSSEPDAFRAFSYATPAAPTIAPFGTVPVWGVLPETDDHAERLLSRLQFGLCDQVAAGEQTALWDDWDIVITRYEEIALRSTSLVIYGYIKNMGTTSQGRIVTRGVVRDADGRLLGTTRSQQAAPLDPGETKRFAVGARSSDHIHTNAYRMMTSPDYTVSLSIEPTGYPIPPGCHLGAPWS